MGTNQASYEQIGVAMTCRSFAEYERMFALENLHESTGPILDVAAGASSFIAEAAARGIAAFAADPLYDAPPDQIQKHGAEEIEISTAKLVKLQERLDFSYYGNMDQHRAMRERSLARFIEDFEQGKREGRYVAAKLPDLPFADDTFTLVLCSHFLFLYHEQFGYEFHIQAIRELYRVTKPGGELRLYPLMTLRFEPYPMLERLLEDVRGLGGSPRLCESKLPFIPKSTQYLVIDKPLA
jgi:SAM-dependent methyltransferase